MTIEQTFHRFVSALTKACADRATNYKRRVNDNEASPLTALVELEMVAVLMGLARDIERSYQFATLAPPPAPVPVCCCVPRLGYRCISCCERSHRLADEITAQVRTQTEGKPS